MQYPYERFLRFLVSRKVDLAQALNRLGLPRVGDLWVSDCRSRFRKTAPVIVRRYLDSDDQVVIFRDGFLEWAKSEQILGLWEIQPEFANGSPSANLDIAFRVFVNPTARAVLGMLLLSKASRDESAAIIKERFDIVIPSEALDLYISLFWDVAAMGRTCWPRFVASLLTKEERHYVSYGVQDPTTDEIRYALGLTQGELNTETVLKNIMSQAHHRFKYAMEQPSPEEVSAFKWAELALKAAHELSSTQKTFQLTAPGASPADSFALFSVEVERTPIMSLTDLHGELPQQPINTILTTSK